MHKKLIGAGAAVVGLALAVGVVFAAAGDPVQPPISPPGPAGAGCGGIGVAFDGTDILYTCAGEAAIRKTDLAGTDNGMVATADAAGAPVSVDAIAWDTNENKLWGGDLDGAGSCRIWSIDMGSGLATLRFSFVDPHGGCSFAFFDGLTVDTVTDTLYLSPDVHKYIHHYNKDGSLGVNDPIDFETLTSAPADVCPGTEPFPDADPVAGCNNSGLAIGLDGTLFAGTNGESKIVTVNPVAKTFTGVFSTVDGRDEDLECGPKVNGLETLLSREFFSGAIAVLEVPEGTCVSPVEPAKGRMTGGGTVVGKAAVGTPTEIKHGFELHCNASTLPNNLEVNWGKGNKFHLESLTSAACSDDPNFDEGQPVAGFDTYKGSGTGSYNGVSGATANWVFTDQGEPGKSDTVHLKIVDGGGTTVVDIVGKLQVGNQQAHNN